MKQTKFGKRLLSGIMSAALLATGALSAAPSVSVKAADSDYYEALALSLYFFDSNACGTEVDGNPLTWRGNCHTYDATASVSGLDSSVLKYVDPDGDGKVDVSGGFHDAGDHIKVNTTIGFGINSLAMAEYLNPGVFEKAGCKDHLIYELKWGADYLMKTTFLDDSGNVAAIAHFVGSGEDHDIWTAPETQTYNRPVYFLTAGDNNSSVCGEMAAALAGTAYVVQDSDPAYAAQCIKYAKALISFGKDHVGNNTSGQGAYYGTDSQYQDEIALAEAWMYILGEGSKPTYTTNGSGAYNGNLYDGYLYCWDKVWQGYAAMMYKKDGDSSFKQELNYELGNKLSESSYIADGWGASRYNCARQMVALALADGDANSSYAKQAKFQMDYILGNNSYGYSFLLGYGDNWPTHIHHRAANPGADGETSAANPSAKYTNYGMLVGGPDSSGYEDHADRYQYTEGALDYNGCFVLACAGLANLYGGSDKAAANIVSSASEVTYPFNFGSGTTVVEPTTTEPVSTTAPVQTDEPVATTAVQTTKAPETTQVVSGEKTASYTEKTGEEGNTYWSFDTTGGQKLTVTFKTNSSDTEANGCYNPPGGWNPDLWTATPSNGTFTLTYDVPAGQTSIDIHVWWPQTCTVESAVLSVQEVVTQPVQTTTTVATTTVTTTVASSATETKQETTTTQTTPGNVVYGDVDGDGKVDVLDVLTLNKNLLGLESITDAQRKNADVDNNGTADATDSLNILKYVVKLINYLPV